MNHQPLKYPKIQIPKYPTGLDGFEWIFSARVFFICVFGLFNG